MFKKTKIPNPPAPRSMDDIQKAYSEALSRAAQAQYLVFVHSRDLEQINEQLLSINQEAAARQKLDKESQPKEDKDVSNS